MTQLDGQTSSQPINNLYTQVASIAFVLQDNAFPRRLQLKHSFLFNLRAVVDVVLDWLAYIYMLRLFYKQDRPKICQPNTVLICTLLGVKN